MARTVRNSELGSREARRKLAVRAKHYLSKIDEGLCVTYRKSKRGGKWGSRIYTGDTKNPYTPRPIGIADDTLDADNIAVFTFSQAQAATRSHFAEFKQAAAGVPSTPAKPFTVADAFELYLARLEANSKTVRDTRWRAEALILPALGATDCAKLTAAGLRQWHKNLADAPPRLRTAKGRPQRFADLVVVADDPDEAARKRRSTANRTLTPLKAALNLCWREGRIVSDTAWRSVMPFREADAVRIRYLTVAEAQRLLNASSPDFRRLVRAALLTGARFGELAAALVGDYNPDSRTFHIRKSKSGKDRHIALNDEGVQLFTELTIGRPARDRLLLKADGGRWLRSHQFRPMREACKIAQIVPPAGFHTLRHSFASHAVMNGAPLLVVAKTLGHVDTRMAEKHYAHLSPDFIAEAIRAAAPRFGPAPTNVTPLSPGQRAS